MHGLASIDRRRALAGGGAAALASSLVAAPAANHALHALAAGPVRRRAPLAPRRSIAVGPMAGALSAAAGARIRRRLADALSASGHFAVVTWPKLASPPQAQPAPSGHALLPAEYLLTAEIGGPGAGSRTAWSGIQLRLIDVRSGETMERLDAADGELVDRLGLAVAGRPWRAQVVRVLGSQLWLGAGRAAGVRVGDRMRLMRVCETLSPASAGGMLAENAVELGLLTVAHLEARVAAGPYRPVLDVKPAIGDFLILADAAGW
ncbi:MAG TPA: hypothetical protein VHZ26_19555 [Caulobacteraceae bacterium]|jgi:hypothetical protein|nr:hypothetical protein [Caulobacteraceae bacterium]